MSPRSGRPRPLAGVSAALCLLAPVMAPTAALGAPVLASADARIRIESPTACAVELAVTVEGASQVEHRVEAVEGSRVELLQVTRRGCRLAEPRRVGRTLSLVVTPGQPAYTLRYHVQQPDSRRDRCPLWLPAVPADGRSRNVRLTVQLPAGATPGGTMPGFVWTGDRGETTLGHLPAFVRVAYAEAGTHAAVGRVARDGRGHAGHARGGDRRCGCSASARPRHAGAADGGGSGRVAMGFGWSFYGFFVAAVVWLVAVLRVGGPRGRARPASRRSMAADSSVLLVVTVGVSGDRHGRVGVGLPPQQDRGGIPRRRAHHRPVGRRRGAGRHADQRRHLRRHARPPLPDRRELDLDLVRRLDRLGCVGDVRRAEAAPVRRAHRRRLRRHALRQRGRAHAGRGAHHRLLQRSC